MTYALTYGVDIFNPSILDGCLFQQFLANSLKSPISRKCYTSGAVLWLADHGGNPFSLVCRQAKQVAAGAALLNPHAPCPAPPLTPHDLLQVCAYLDTAPSGRVVKAATCIGFFSFLRSSNLLAPSVLLWRGPHTLTRKDVVSGEHGLFITIRSSKTIKLGTSPTVLSLPRIPGSIACPATAWDAYVNATPAPPGSPAFVTPFGAPLTPAQMTLVLQTGLARKGCPYAGEVTLHSLRRGGTQAAILAKSPREDVATHGTWKSVKGMKPYLPSAPSSRVAATMAALFAPKVNN